VISSTNYVFLQGQIWNSSTHAYVDIIVPIDSLVCGIYRTSSVGDTG